MKLSTLAALACLTLLPSTAFATELNLKTLSGLPALTPGSGTYSVTKDGVTVTFTALNNGSASSSTDLTWQNGDGFGVDTPTDSNGTTANDKTAGGDVLITSDEINAKESIKVTFSKEVLIQSIAITDIYDEQQVKGYWFLWPTETGAWKVTSASGSDVGTFEGVSLRDGTNNGEIKVNINELATILSVYSTNTGSEANYKGFSLAGITFTAKSVPELSGQGIGAAAFLLFGAAQILGARRRRFVAA
jgi:hypothetical protein